MVTNRWFHRSPLSWSISPVTEATNIISLIGTFTTPYAGFITAGMVVMLGTAVVIALRGRGR